MIVEKRRIKGVTILTVEGVIKLGQSAQFLAEALKRALSEDVGNVAVDLGKINLIDSTGIGELVGYLWRFQEQKRKLILIRPADRIRRLLEVANVAELFTIYDDLDSALENER